MEVKEQSYLIRKRDSNTMFFHKQGVQSNRKTRSRNIKEPHGKEYIQGQLFDTTTLYTRTKGKKQSEIFWLSLATLDASF